ncbi:MAG: CRISPR-associated endonuclease Cas1 [Methanothrix sp.]|uniref:CRISPR-associated endonuclease Cas1 n=1 Tax=Methanothrix sp. TaxID=90426 RepID=UPI0025DBE274|nr:CRISPR-associated endonuclease Cas1 [Methanothrix sp.]MCQ8903787.1 CRISPR-associated endonuclease Cas1 [Methanothrix sp.]
MQLVVNSYGSYIRKSGECFVVKIEDRSLEVAAKKISSILIATAAYITTDAIKLAIDNNIDIVFLDSRGDPYARIWHPKLGSTTLIRRRQLEIYGRPEALAFVREWCARKLENQIGFLKKLKKSREERRGELEGYIDEISISLEEMLRLRGTVEARRQEILGLEGRASRAYFQAISLIMPEGYRFAGRSRDPARDEFNAMLNYGYGMLYSIVEKSCIIAGLDPYAGFLHTDSYNKRSLVFDIIEMFRIYIEEPVVHMFTRRMVRDEFFEPVEQGVVLSREGRAALIDVINRALDETVEYRGRKVKVRNTIQMECHRIANKLIRGDMEEVTDDLNVIESESDTCSAEGDDACLGDI